MTSYNASSEPLIKNASDVQPPAAIRLHIEQLRKQQGEIRDLLAILNARLEDSVLKPSRERPIHEEVAKEHEEQMSNVSHALIDLRERYDKVLVDLKETIDRLEV